MIARLTAAVLLAWQAGPVLLAPGPAGTFDETAVKDPSTVHNGGTWHVFYTARGRNQYTLGHVTAASLDGPAGAPRHQLPQLHGQAPYAAAPQVFYFQPQQRWYLIFQTTDANYQPVYSTTATLDLPASWSRPVPLIAKDESAKWIDFWVICDDNSAYLFYTRAQSEVYVRSTRLPDFPHGWGPARVALAGVHEAVHVYRVRGSSPARYVMLYEVNDHEVRRFGLAEAATLEGPWQRIDDRFATGEQLTFPAGIPAWTAEVSHGELLRAGSDQRLEIEPDRWRFLIQGLRRDQHRGDYPSLPWRLGLIEKR